MRTRTFTIIALLWLTCGSIYAQDSPEGYGGDLYVNGEGKVRLVPLRIEAPQHRVLKGMGLGLRQITDWLVYEHFPLADQTGMVVEELLANLPAHKAGIRWHDVIAKVDGKSISSVDDFIAAYNDCKTDEVPVEIIQKGQSKIVNIAKAEVAKWERDYRIGVHVESIPKELALHLGWPKAKPGLFVSGVVEGSPAETAGLKEGDLLLKANETPLKSSDVLNNLVRESQGREISLEYLRAGKTRRAKLAAAEQTKREAEFTGWLMADLLAGGLGFDAVAPQNSRAESAALQRLVEAVEQLSKDVAELRSELKKKE